MKHRSEIELQQKKRWLSLSFLLAVIFCFSKYFSPYLIGYLYNHNLDLLNQLTSVNTQLSLDFYLGRMRTLYLGPLTQLAAGFSFLIICYFYLRESSLKVFWVSVFLFLLITKLDVLFLPPYGDSASGPFIEAIWLKQHNFNYLELAKQPAFVYGGPKVYLFSLFPTWQALLMKLIPSVSLFLVINHLIVYVLGAGIIAIFRSLASKNFNSIISLLLAFLVLSLPLFHSQVEQINMEAPMVFGAILAVYFLKEKNFLLASLMAMIATMIKGTGIVVCLTVIAVCSFLVIFDKDKKVKLYAICAVLITATFSFLMTYASIYILNDSQDVVMVGPFKGLRWMKNYLLVYLLIGALLIGIQSFISDLKKPKLKFQEVIDRYFLFFIMFITVLSWFGLYINSYGDQYRYRFLLAPFSAFCLFFIFNKIVKSEVFQKYTLILLIAISFLGSYGFFYQPPDTNLDAEYERSLEYRNDLELDRLVAKKMESDYADYLIVAPFTTAQTLAFPELGYVHKKLDVMLYGYPCLYEGIRVFDGLKSFNMDKTIWIGLKSKLPFNTAKLIKNYPVGPADKVIEKIYMGKREATLFQGGYSVEQRRILLKGSLKLDSKYRAEPDKY